MKYIVILNGFYQTVFIMKYKRTLLCRTQQSLLMNLTY